MLPCCTSRGDGLPQGNQKLAEGSNLGAALLPEQEIDFHRVNNGPAGGGNAARGGLRDVHADLEGAVNSIFAGGPAQRRAVVERLYAKVWCALHTCSCLLRAGEQHQAVGGQQPAAAAGCRRLDMVTSRGWARSSAYARHCAGADRTIPWVLQKISHEHALRDAKTNIRCTACMSSQGMRLFLRGVLNAHWQDAVVWNAMYVVRGRQAIFGAVNLWCSMNKIEVKINRMGGCTEREAYILRSFQTINDTLSVSDGF